MQDLMPQIIEFTTKHTIMVVAWVAVLILVIVTFGKDIFSKAKTLDFNQATLLINNEDAVVVDIRSQADFAKGHIVDSVQVNSADIKTGKIPELEKYRDRPLIVACYNGANSQGVAEKLIKLGFKASSLQGGINAWNAANLPLTRK